MKMKAIAPMLLAFAMASPANAEDLPQPAGQVILTITGAIENTNADGEARFDLAMLDSLPQRETITSTPWYDGDQTFSGPLLSELMSLVGAEGSEIRVIAINDFAANMPFSDVSDYPTILASRHNGETMSVREKGPLFVIYPFDEHSELRDEVHFSRSVWQVVAIEVLP